MWHRGHRQAGPGLLEGITGPCGPGFSHLLNHSPSLSTESHAVIVLLFIYLDQVEEGKRNSGGFQPNYPGDAQGYREGLLCDMN